MLRLFVVMNDNRTAQRSPLGNAMACPRCHARLALTADMQRTTRFSYWRCPAEHGRFITFFEFLREKNFVRPLSVSEIDRLKQNVHTITCSSCGAPVDLQVGAVCPYCQAPLSMLDAKQVDAEVQELKREQARREEASRNGGGPDLAMRLMQDKLTVDRDFGRLGQDPFGLEPSGGDGLVEAGVAAVAALLKRSGSARAA